MPKSSTKELHCGFCRRGVEVDSICGRLWHNKEPKCTAHQKCMQYSACLSQYESKTFGGFKIKQVLKEQKRGGPLKCSACAKDKKWKKVGGATAGCAISKCKKTYHLYCAATTDGVIRQRIECFTQESDKPDILYRVFCSQKHKVLFESEQKKNRRAVLRDVSDSEQEAYDMDISSDGEDSDANSSHSHSSSKSSLGTVVPEDEGSCDGPSNGRRDQNTLNAQADGKRGQKTFERIEGVRTTDGNSGEQQKQKALNIQEGGNVSDIMSTPENDCILAKRKKVQAETREDTNSGIRNAQTTSTPNIPKSTEERNSRSTVDTTKPITHDDAQYVSDSQMLRSAQSDDQTSGDELRCSTDGARDIAASRARMTRSIRALCPETPRIELCRQKCLLENFSNMSAEVQAINTKNARNDGSTDKKRNSEEPMERYTSERGNLEKLNAKSINEKKKRNLEETMKKSTKEKQNSNQETNHKDSGLFPGRDIVVCIIEDPSINYTERTANIVRRCAWKTFNISEEYVFLWQYSGGQSLTSAHLIYLINDIAKALVKADNTELRRLIFDQDNSDKTIEEFGETGGSLHCYDSTVKHNESSLDSETRDALYDKLRAQIANNMRLSNEYLSCDDSIVARFCHIRRLETHVAMIKLCNKTDSSGEVRSRILSESEVSVTSNQRSSAAAVYEWKRDIAMRRDSGEGSGVCGVDVEYAALRQWMGENVVTMKTVCCIYPRDEVLSRALSVSDTSLSSRLYNAFMYDTTCSEDDCSEKRDRKVHVGFVLPGVLVFYVPYVRKLIKSLLDVKLSAECDLCIVLDVGPPTDVTRIEDLISVVYLSQNSITYSALVGRDPSKYSVSCAILSFHKNS